MSAPAAPRRDPYPRDDDVPDAVLASRGLSDAVRRLIATLVATGAPAEVLDAARAEIDAVAASLHPFAARSRYDDVAGLTFTPGSTAVFEHHPFLGPSNPMAPPVAVVRGEDQVTATLTFDLRHEGMPGYVVRRVAERLNKQRKALNGSRILIMGLAYKPNVDDMRESPTFKLFDLLRAQGAEIGFYDPHVPVITPTREHAEYTGWKSIEWNQPEVSSFDLVLISTNHAKYNLAELAAWAPTIVDTRNAMADIATAAGQVTKA